MVSRDPLRDVLEFPEGDVEVGIVPRKIRTEMLVVPDDPPLVKKLLSMFYYVLNKIMLTI
jgi:Domain of unknown function (DUF3398)